MVDCFNDVIKEEKVPTGGELIPMANLAVISSVAKAIAIDPFLLAPQNTKPSARTIGGEGGPGDREVEGGDGGGIQVSAAGNQVASVLTKSERARMLKLLNAYTDAGFEALQASYSVMRSIEKANQRALQARGELSDEATLAYDRAKRTHERLQGGCNTLADVLAREMPVMQDEQEERREAVSVSVVGAAGNNPDGDDLYADAEARAFYEQLPDLRSVLPAVLFGDDDSGGGGAGIGSDALEAKATVEGLLSMLPRIMSKSEIDDLASEVVCKGAKSHIRLIVRSLASPPLKRPEAQRFYGRFAAILSACFRSIGTEVCSLILDDFEQAQSCFVGVGAGGRFAAAKGGGGGVGDSADAAAALYTCQYLGELVKFHIVPAASAFSCLKVCTKRSAPLDRESSPAHDRSLQIPCRDQLLPQPTPKCNTRQHAGRRC